MVAHIVTPNLTTHVSYNSVQVIQSALLASRVLDLARYLYHKLSGPHGCCVEATTTTVITISRSVAILSLS